MRLKINRIYYISGSLHHCINRLWGRFKLKKKSRARSHIYIFTVARSSYHLEFHLTLHHKHNTLFTLYASQSCTKCNPLMVLFGLVSFKQRLMTNELLNCPYGQPLHSVFHGDSCFSGKQREVLLVCHVQHDKHIQTWLHPNRNKHGREMCAYFDLNTNKSFYRHPQVRVKVFIVDFL